VAGAGRSGTAGQGLSYLFHLTRGLDMLSELLRKPDLRLLRLISPHAHDPDDLLAHREPVPSSPLGVRPPLRITAEPTVTCHGVDSLLGDRNRNGIQQRWSSSRTAARWCVR